MQGGRGGPGGPGGPGGRGPFFGFNDPFAGFGGFGGLRGQTSLISNVFGGRDPFDDPFFTRPFGGVFESSFFGNNGGGGFFPDMQHPTGFIQHQPQALTQAPQQPRQSRGPIIEEIDSDHENEEEDGGNERKENPRKRGGSSNEPYVVEPDDEVETERKRKHSQYGDGYNRFGVMQSQPQARSFTFQSSTVTYGGSNGACYTSSKTRRMGSDGLAFEESKEADTASGQATHRVSKGLHNKGHSVTRKLETDGKVDTMQTLHNLNEDELSGFEEAWNGTAQKHLPGWTDKFSGYANLGSSSGHGQASQGGWALPSNEVSQNPGNVIQDARDIAGSTRSQQSGRMRADVRDRSGYPRGGARD